VQDKKKSHVVKKRTNNERCIGPNCILLLIIVSCVNVVVNYS